MSARLFALFAALAAILLAGSFVLAEGPRVVLLGPSSQHPTVVRVQEELQMLGFDVQVVQAKGAGDLAALARSYGAAAAARVEGSEIVLWVDPDDPGQEIRVSASLNGPPDLGLLALRAVELLRGRLLRLPPDARADGGPGDAGIEAAPRGPAAPPAPAAPAPPRDGAVAPAPRALRPVALLAGPAVLLSPGGVPAAFHVRLGAQWDPAPRVGVEVMAFVPATGGKVEAPQGSIDLRVVDFGGGIRGVLTDPLADLGLAVGIGLNAMLLLFEGRASPPWMAAHGGRWAASPYADVTVSYRLHPRVALRLDLLGALARPEPVLRIAGREVASFGQPAVFSSLSVEVRP